MAALSVEPACASLSVEPPKGLGFTYWVGGGGRATKVPHLSFGFRYKFVGMLLINNGSRFSGVWVWRK